MFKKIAGWFLLIFGIVGAILGLMAYFGGASLSAAIKMLALSLVLAGAGWTLRSRR